MCERGLPVIRIITIAALVAIAAGRAEAYPQFQIGRDQTCSACHISPAGGGLLNENGLNVAGTISTWGTAPEFFYGKIPQPDWLDLGGDMRGAAGYFQSPFETLSGFPMQTDVYASPHYQGFRLYVTAGYRPPENGNETATAVWSREHYLMWQSDPGTPYGLFVRVGRFMPVFGLRFAEHTDYTRQFGGTALYTETYGAAVEYLAKQFEVHATGFMKDPLIDPVDTANGAALYAEYRLTDNAAVGVEGMFQQTIDDKRYRGGLTGKVFIPGPDLQLMGEVQFVSQVIDAGGAPKQAVGYVLASRDFGGGIQADVGLGYYNEDLRIAKLDRDCGDLNIHWYMTSHVEIIWNNRLELMGFGKGAPTGAYSIFQLHYRL